MIVNVKDLRDDTPVIEQDVSMTSEQINDAGIDGTIHCKAVVSKLSSKYYLSIDFDGSIKNQCARCTEDFKKSIKGNAKVLLQEEGEGDGDDFDGEVITFKSIDETVDVREAVYEEIMLAGSIMPLCREDCPGIVVEEEEEEDSVDPRWEALRKLKDKK